MTARVNPHVDHGHHGRTCVCGAQQGVEHATVDVGDRVVLALGRVAERDREIESEGEGLSR